MATYSPDGGTLLDFTWNSHQAATIRGASVRLFSHPPGSEILSIAFSQDGSKVLTSADDGTARLWQTFPVFGDSLDPIAVYEYPSRYAWNVCMSSDQRYVVISGNGPTTLYEASTGIRIREGINHGGGGLPFAISPDSTRIVTVGTEGNRLVVHDLESFEFIREIPMPTDEVVSTFDLAISSNGLKLVGCGPTRRGRPHRAFVWDFPSGILLSTLEGHTNAIVTCDINADGSTVVTGSFDKTARVWTL